MNSYQKRVITAVVRNLKDKPDLAANVLKVHQRGRLSDVSWQEIRAYAKDRWNVELP